MPEIELDPQAGTANGFHHGNGTGARDGIDSADRSHRAYLARMADEQVVPPGIAAAALQVWLAAQRAAPAAAVPAAAAYEGGPIHYTWDDGRRVVTVEVFSPTVCDWYTDDRQTDEYAGGEFDPAAELPAAVVRTLTAMYPPPDSAP